MRTHILILVLLAASAGPATGQTYGIDRCHPSGIGAVLSAGQVRYTLGKDGAPDTSTIAVLAIDRISAAGYQSVVARFLSGCRMKHPDQPLAVVQGIRFDTAGAHLTPAVPATGAETVLAIDGPRPRDPAPLEATDSTLEEHPSWITCDRPPHTQPPSTAGRSSAADQSMFASASPLNSGMVTARLLVGEDGRVVKDSLKLVSSDNPQNTSNLLRALASCHYAPGRIGGVPVATRLTATIIVGPAGYSVVPMPAARNVLNGR